MSTLTEEQKQRIEDNRKRALELKSNRIFSCKNQQSTSCGASTSSGCSISTQPIRLTKKDVSKTTTTSKDQIAAFIDDIQKPRKKAGEVFGKCRLISKEKFQVQPSKFSQELINVFKTTNTKVYDPQTRTWAFNLQEYSQLVGKCKNSDLELEPLPDCVLKAFTAALKGQPTSPHSQVDLSSIDETLRDTLMLFQRETINYAVAHKGRILIADDMGLGKTLQALCIAAYYKSEWPLLIVTPSSVRFSWRQQIQQWLPSVPPDCVNVIVNGRESATSGRINIISYDLMVRLKDQLIRKKFRVVIMDESHYVKNIKTARTKVATILLKTANRVILLSGTPALSRPIELFPQVSAVNPTVFSKFHDFGVRYCDGKQNPWGWDFSGSSNLSELQILLEECVMVRRLKSDVLSQLPSKTRQMVILDPEVVKVTKYLQSQQEMVLKSHGMERHGALLQYFHESARAKMAAVKEYIMDLLESDRKFLIFAHHQELLDYLEESISGKVSLIRLDGRTGSAQRQVLCTRYQEHPEVQVALLSITAANAGINLTAASLVVFAELFWNPGILVQAEDRAHRIGQEDNVTVHYLVARGTADDLLWPIIQRKLGVLSRAGLSKNDFDEADTTVYMDRTKKKQLELEEFLVKSVLENPKLWSDLPDEATAAETGDLEPGMRTKPETSQSEESANQHDKIKSETGDNAEDGASTEGDCDSPGNPGTAPPSDLSSRNAKTAPPSDRKTDGRGGLMQSKLFQYFHSGSGSRQGAGSDLADEGRVGEGIDPGHGCQDEQWSDIEEDVMESALAEVEMMARGPKRAKLDLDDGKVE